MSRFVPKGFIKYKFMNAAIPKSFVLCMLRPPLAHRYYLIPSMPIWRNMIPSPFANLQSTTSACACNWEQRKKKVSQIQSGWWGITNHCLIPLMLYPDPSSTQANNLPCVTRRSPSITCVLKILQVSVSICGATVKDAARWQNKNRKWPQCMFAAIYTYWI